MRALCVWAAAWATSHLAHRLSARSVHLAFTTTIRTQRHHVMILIPHALLVTTLMLDHTAVTSAPLVWLTWTAIHRRRAPTAQLALCRRVGAHHAQSAGWVRLMMTLIRRRRAWHVARATSVHWVLRHVLDVRTVVLTSTWTLRQLASHVGRVSTPA